MNPCDLPGVFDHTTPAFRQVITYITLRIRHRHYYQLKKWSNAMAANPFTETAPEISHICHSNLLNLTQFNKLYGQQFKLFAN